MAKFRVLVVEDDEFLRDGVKDLLEWEGCEVDSAPDGGTAFEYLRRARSPHQLIFLDLNMPKMSGQEFLRRLHQDPALASIPVIVMTAVPNAQVAEARSMLQKPMEFEEIVEKLNEVRRNCEHAQGTAGSI